MSDNAWDNSLLLEDIKEIVITKEEIQARVAFWDGVLEAIENRRAA